jgi:hypothetical protein
LSKSENYSALALGKALASTEHFWDGRFRGEDVAVGVYTYVADLEFLDGGKEIMTGEVMILR